MRRSQGSERHSSRLTAHTGKRIALASDHSPRPSPPRYKSVILAGPLILSLVSGCLSVLLGFPISPRAQQPTMNDEHSAEAQATAVQRKTTFDAAAQPSRRSTTNTTTNPITTVTTRSSSRSNPFQLLRQLTIPDHKLAQPPSLMHGIKAIITGSCQCSPPWFDLLAHPLQGSMFCLSSYPYRCVIPPPRSMMHYLTLSVVGMSPRARTQ